MDPKQRILVSKPDQDPREVRVKHPKDLQFHQIAEGMSRFGWIQGGWTEYEGVEETITRIVFRDVGAARKTRAAYTEYHRTHETTPELTPRLASVVNKVPQREDESIQLRNSYGLNQTSMEPAEPNPLINSPPATFGPVYVPKSDQIE